MNKLPPIPEETFDGEKYSIELKTTKCSHKQMKLINPREIRCSCGIGYTGMNVQELLKLFTEQSS